VRFGSINVDPRDGDRLGAVSVLGDAKLALAALADEVARRGVTAPAEWRIETESANDDWAPVRTAALDADTPVDLDALRASSSDVIPDTGAALTQGQLIGLLQEHARPGDTVIAAAGGPPGDLMKVWDATEGQHCHLEFGFSCMGYEIPAAIGVRLATPDTGARVISLLGDGTFMMAPTELATAAQEALPITLVIPENHGYQVIHRLQMLTTGREFGNEFRYRPAPLQLEADKSTGLVGDYLELDLVQIARGLGAHAVRATSTAEVREALASTRTEQRPVVIVVPVVPHADLPSAGCWWDVAPAEVSESDTVREARASYETALPSQRWFG
jgi:3D-(3,5/4)-trihydroxycyclohexane-1,2-dione acylhydrolase (decyclizing)